MKTNKFHSVLAGLFLFLWAATLYPGELFHNHADEVHECHLQCDVEAEIQGIHKECDHTYHIHESSVPCFLCEFTFQKTYLLVEQEEILPGYNEFFYTGFDPNEILFEVLKTQSTRGPPLNFC